MKASSSAFLPQPWASLSRVWEKAKCSISPRLLSNHSLGGGPRAWKGRGEQSSTCISYQPGAGKTPRQNE